MFLRVLFPYLTHLPLQTLRECPQRAILRLVTLASYDPLWKFMTFLTIKNNSPNIHRYLSIKSHTGQHFHVSCFISIVFAAIWIGFISFAGPLPIRPRRGRVVCIRDNGTVRYVFQTVQ